jgi:acetyl-CoA synthetase
MEKPMSQPVIYPTIQKVPDPVNPCNLTAERLDSGFDWARALAEVAAADGTTNICREALDRHLPHDGARIALRFIGRGWPKDTAAVQDISYQQLATLTMRFANALHSLGVQQGDVLFALSPRIPALYTVVLGALRAGVVFSPLFSAFGPEPIAARMGKGNARVIFSLASQYRKKIAPIRESIPTLQHIILIDDDGSLKDILQDTPGAVDFNALMNSASEQAVLAATRAEDHALMHFTSGTTGKPKGAVHVHAAVAYHKYSGQFALDIKADDIFWCTADPGWVTGVSYGIISPLVNGATLLIDEADFQAQRWYEILQSFKVDVWYTAPTAMRMLMKNGEELPRAYNFSSVRLAASVGEPLNPEVIHWVKENLGIALHDNWWQSETGGIIISNYRAMAIKPGSMGKPIPGMEVALVKSHEKGALELAEKSGECGEIAIRRGWPSMFRGYLGDDEKYQRCFVGEWYLSGDLASRDDDGYYWFVGRTDDVIKSSGHLIGPFEVESVLMEHPAVLESAVIGIPDPVAGELVKAYVVLKSGFVAEEELQLSIVAHARKRLGVAVAPREVSFIADLPKTRSGKIMRRLLKARELGLPEGDTSTLENG